MFLGRSLFLLVLHALRAADMPSAQILFVFRTQPKFAFIRVLLVTGVEMPSCLSAQHWKCGVQARRFSLSSGTVAALCRT